MSRSVVDFPLCTSLGFLSLQNAQESGKQNSALDVLKKKFKLKLLVISSFPYACFSHYLMQDVATAAVQREYKEPMMIIYDTVTPG